MVYVWLGLIVAFIAVEAATVNLVSIWFIGGSVAGLVCAILGAPTLLQFAVFILVSALLLALLRPLLKKYLRVKPSRTNADRLLGQEALVTEDIDNLRETGAIRINGVLWTAKTLHPQTYGEAQYKDAAKMLYETYYGFTPDEAAL